MARLGFTLTWLGLSSLDSFWFGLFHCLKKIGGENTGVERQ